MKIKHIIFLSILSLYLIISSIIYFNIKKVDGQPFTEYDGFRCGKVIDNFTEIRTVKYGTNTDYYLKINYGNYYKIENVNAETFYECSKIGSNICLINKKPINPFIIIGPILSIFAMVIILLYFLTNFLID